jgi:PTS system mannose-specific IIB component
MRIVRIDDRLIHGQVIVGWVKKLGLDSLILLHNEMDNDIIELYAGMLEEEIDFTSIDISKSDITCKANAIYVAESLNLLYDFKEKLTAIKFDLFNFGGLRTKVGKEKILDFIYMDKTEMERTLELSSLLNTKINAQELPESENFNILKIIKERL